MAFGDHQAGEQAWKQTAADLGPGKSGAGGRFVYDKDQMRAIAQKWEELATHFGQSFVKSQAMGTVTGPGNEYASGSHAVDANISGSAYLGSLSASRDYCHGQAAKYRKVLGEIVEVDEENHRKLQHPSSPLDGGI
jgi:hypothetical protein